MKYEVITKRKQESLQTKAIDTPELQKLEDVGEAVLSLYQAASGHVAYINHGFHQSRLSRATPWRHQPTQFHSPPLPSDVVAEQFVVE